MGFLLTTRPDFISIMKVRETRMKLTSRIVFTRIIGESERFLTTTIVAELCHRLDLKEGKCASETMVASIDRKTLFVLLLFFAIISNMIQYVHFDWKEYDANDDEAHW